MEKEISLAAKVSVGMGLVLGVVALIGSLVAHLVGSDFSTLLLDVSVIGFMVAAFFWLVWTWVLHIMTR